MEGIGLDYCVAAVWRANGLIQQRRIDEGLALLEQLSHVSRDPWTASSSQALRTSGTRGAWWPAPWGFLRETWSASPMGRRAVAQRGARGQAWS